MDSKTETRIETMFRLLDEQHRILNQWPYTSEVLKKDRRVSGQLREICDQLYPEPSNAQERNNSHMSKKTSSNSKLTLLLCICETLALARKIRDFINTKGLAMVQIRCLGGFETKSEAFA